MAARLIVAATAAASFLTGIAVADPVEPAKPASAALRFSYEVEAAEIIRRLQARAPKGLVRIDNVRLVDPRSGKVDAGSTIIVRGSRIRWVGPATSAPDTPDATRIDGKDRYAAPGLSDMHIHSVRADGWLLNLAVGVTTVRDMDGFPWILSARDAINAGRMLGPTSYVAGTIITSEPLSGYSVIAAGPEDGRRIVRQQAACGYDFIKVHNQLRQPILDAVAAQAAELGMDLVGHVPHDISIQHGLQTARMRTTEHLKGFLNDRTLLPNDDDYAAALAGTTTWITPTLYTQRSRDRGPWARSVMASEEARLVPPYVRAEWAELLAHPDPDEVALGERFLKTQKIVMGRLLPLRPRWLTGTDAAGYAFAIMGHALLDEMALLRGAGLSPAEAYRASTVEAADALHEDGEFGAIGRGMRADLVLLERNPLTDASAFASNEGVMTRGQWLDRPAIDHALSELTKAYSISHPRLATQPAALVARAEKATVGGFVFDDAILERFEEELLKNANQLLAARIHALRAGPKAGICSVPNPEE